MNWSKLTRDEFDRAVQALLSAVFNSSEDRAEVLRGDGGDGGIDVAHYRGGELYEIFQLKFFPEGFSNKFTGRRQQIKKSFERAWIEHQPSRWTLVVPQNPSQSEIVYINGLPQGRDCRVRVVGEAWLDSKMKDFPELAAYMKRDDLLETLERVQMEKASITKISDLADRALLLGHQSQSLSANWAANFSYDGGGATIAIVPKHAQALELEPIYPKVQLQFSEEHDELRQQYFKTRDFGVRKPFTLPSSVVLDFELQGPEWLAGNSGPGELTYLPSPTEPHKIQLRFLNAEGEYLSSHTGTLHQSSAGDRGFGLTANFYGVLELDFEIPLELSEQGHVSLSTSYEDALISDAVKALKLHQQLHVPSRPFEIWLRDKRLMRAQAPEQAGEGPDRLLAALIEDLDVIGRAKDTDFTLPRGLTDRERISIRIGRLIAERKPTWMLPGTRLNGYLTDKAAGEGLDMLLAGQVAIRSDIDPFRLEILGMTFNFGRVMLFHPAVQLIEGEQIAAAVRRGTAAGMEFVLAPVSEQLVMAVPLGEGGLDLENADPQEPIKARGWDLLGLESHRGNIGSSEVQAAIEDLSGSATELNRDSNK